jgi:ATP-binding cassette subfamily B protein
MIWPYLRGGDAMEALAGHGGLPLLHKDLASPGTADAAWVEAAAQTLGLEAETLATPYIEMEDMLAHSRLLLYRVKEGWLAIAGAGRVLGPDLRLHRVPVEELRALICEAIERPAKSGLAAFLNGVGLPASRRDRATRALLSQQLAGTPVNGWRLRVPADAPFAQSLPQAGIVGRLAALAASQIAYLLVWLLAWWVIGVAALGGHLDRGWLYAWGLLLLTLAPLRVAALWQQGVVAVRLGALLKQRLLAGSLRLDPEAVLAEGAGRLLGRVLEADAVETLALAGGFTGAVAMLELVAAVAVLALGGPPWAVPALLLWIGLAALSGWEYLRRARRWTDTRMTMTGALVERMSGHRTRLAQETPARWHEGEDRELHRYLESSLHRDRAEAFLATVIPRGWLALGIITLAPVLLTQGASPALLAATFGGILLAYRAFRRLAAAFWQLVDARICWEQIQPLMAAASTRGALGSPLGSLAANDASGVAALEAHDLMYRYPAREIPVLSRCSLQVQRGDRILLEGPSGGGKSTLVAVLLGIRPPQAGVLLAGGLDRSSVGEQGWRRRIVAAPQFHQNHVITGPLAFNLLMGRPGPLGPADEREALEICREMGLGELLERMPGGLFQQVGETGWQLSQGERSRIFMARALLQGAGLVVLDETFAALDPETMRQTLACVLKRAPSLLVIAHQ